MSKYPEQSCRNCRSAKWVWLNKTYPPEGKKRIIVQQPGTCLAEQSKAGRGSAKSALDARKPYSDCSAWEQLD